MAATTSADDPPPESTTPCLIPALPDDISLRIIARVPRSSYRSLRHVSRAWRHLLNSPLLLSIRSHLSTSEPILCVHLHSPSSSTSSSTWALLYPHLGPTLLPSPPLPVSGASSAVAATGPYLFLLGGSHSGVPTSAVQILDSRAATWGRGPRMSAPREFSAAGFLPGKILVVVGGCFPLSDSWAETLDIDNSDKWTQLPSSAHIREKWMHGSAVLNGKLLAVADRGGVVYDPNPARPELSWGPVSPVLDLGWKGRAAVVNGILYSYDFVGKIKGYDPGADEWRMVDGVDKALPRFLCGATLANVGGVLCVLWEGKRKGDGRKGMVVDWAGIQVEKEGGGGLRGRVLWIESVTFDVPKGSSVAHCVALEL